MEKAEKRDVMPPVGRWGEREQGIIEVASQLYLQGGYDNVSMAAVAAAAGLSEGTLYNYFRDKQDLQLRVSLATFEGHIEKAERAVAESKSLRDGLEALIAIELGLLIEAKELFRAWMRELRGTSGYAQSEARKVLRRFSSQLIHLFAKWNASPDPRLGLNLPLMRDIVFGSLEHIVWTALVQNRVDQIDVPKMSRDLAAAYLRAFGMDSDVGGSTSRRRAARTKSNRKTEAQRRSQGSKHRGAGTRHTSARHRSSG
jgi:TetR/AcrR family transcriptional regulator, fatty acid metabolism regulator protein